MGEMAMELAHEIRNPLASIELYASMTHGEYADQIVRSVRLLNHTVSNILQFGKPIQPDLKTTSIIELFDSVATLVRPMAAHRKVCIDVCCEPGVVALADFQLIHRMLLNLALNAMRE